MKRDINDNLENKEHNEQEVDLHENRSVDSFPASECLNRGEESYWQDVESKAIDPKLLRDEFKEGEIGAVSPEKTRRDFLKIMGFSFSVLPLSSCLKIPPKKVIPFLQKNDQIVPGVPTWFTSKYHTCNCGAPLLLKTREGRPIKVEGNDKSSWTEGGACAVCQGSVVELYDSYRLKTPLKNGVISSYDHVASELSSSLKDASGKKVAFVVRPFNSPSQKQLYSELVSNFPKIDLIPYQSYSNSARYAALKSRFGVNSLVEYDLSSVDLLVSFEMDLIGTEKNATAYAKQYSKRREASPTVSPIRHIQVESVMSLTGSNADERFAVNRSVVKKMLVGLHMALLGESLNGVGLDSTNQGVVTKIANALKSASGRSLVVTGINDQSLEAITFEINALLSNWGKTIKAFEAPYALQESDSAFSDFIIGAKAQKYSAVVFVDVNPAYSYADQESLSSALKNIPTKIAFTYAENETSALCSTVVPFSHSFESWNDYVISSKEVGISQAVIVPLYQTKQIEDVLLQVMGSTETFYDYIRNNWKKTFFTKQKDQLVFDTFWDKTVEMGLVQFADLGSEVSNSKGSFNVDRAQVLKSLKDSGKLELVMYQGMGMRDGSFANNPWLQELPDPITKLTWDNALLVSPELALNGTLKTGDIVLLKNSKYSVMVPVLVQPGMGTNTLGLAVGYGRVVTGKAGKNVGKNAYPFNVNNSFDCSNIEISKVAGSYNLALTQTHHSMEGRSIVREANYAEFKNNPKAGNEKKTHLITMWSEHKKDGQQWAMAVDLSKCNGCSSCIVSCNIENNVPVVGKEEVFNRREMHWMRIDRYYKGSDSNPSVVYQPMNCQHCENAPCETVCPVLATVHSSDGLNQQVYNRCVGTRYCANNCPYKVRRFNWFDYPHNDKSENMVLNPDVAVRSRGVMEKCSLCIQRIQEAKLSAKKEGRDLKDGEIKLACQQSCPSNAIIFGDVNDPNSEISKVLKDSRNYTVLDELNVKPRVSYLTKIRNKE